MNGLSGIGNNSLSFDGLSGNSALSSATEEEAYLTDSSNTLIKGLFDEKIKAATNKMMLEEAAKKQGSSDQNLFNYVDLIQKTLPIDSSKLSAIAEFLYAKSKEALSDLYSSQGIIDQKKYVTLNTTVQSLISLVEHYADPMSISWLGSLYQDMKKGTPLKKTIEDKFKKWSTSESLDLSILKKEQNLSDTEIKKEKLKLMSTLENVLQSLYKNTTPPDYLDHLTQMLHVR